jgi:hypothetical protein
VRNGTLLYRDDSHLTAAGVKALQPAIQAQVREKGIDPERPLTFGGETA